jgi:hypothetical protein
MVSMVQPAAATPIRPGDSFWVAWATDQNPYGQSIDIFPASASNSSTPLQHLDTTWQPAGQILMSLPSSAGPGSYELRLRAGGTGVTLATYTLVVGAASTTGPAAPGPGAPGPAAPTGPLGGLDLGGLVRNPLVIGAVGLIVAAQVGLIGGRRR